MKKIYDFSRSPSMRNYTVADLQALKQSNKKLSMSNPKDATELKACVDAEIDLLVVWDSKLKNAAKSLHTILWEWAALGRNSETVMTFSIMLLK